MKIVDYLDVKNTPSNRRIDDIDDYFSTFFKSYNRIKEKSREKNRLNRLSRRKGQNICQKNRLENRLSRSKKPTIWWYKMKRILEKHRCGVI